MKQRLFPVEPVLPGYRQPKNRNWILARNALFLGLLIFVSLFYGLLSAIFPISFYIYMAFPLLVIGGLVVWALPDSGRLPIRTIEGFFWLFLYAQLVWPNYIAIALPGLPWITINRLVTAPLALMFILSLRQSRELRTHLSDVLATNKLVSRCFIGLIIIEVLTLPMSDEVAASLNRLIDIEVQWNLIFFVAALVFSQDGRAKKFFIAYPWLILFLVTIAVFEYRKGGVLWAESIPSFLKADDESTQRLLAGSARQATGTYRVQSIFSTSLNFAEVLGLSTPIFIYWAMYAKRFLVRIGAVACMPLIYWMILRTDSRLGVVAFFASFIVFAGIYGMRRWIMRKNDILGPALVLFYPFATALFFVATLVSRRLGNAIWGTGATAASTEGRKMQWIMAMPKLVEWPFGHGTAQGAGVLGTRNPLGILTIDSYYLVILLEYGVLGFILWLGVMIGAAVAAVRWSLFDDSEEGLMLPIMATFIMVFVIVKGVLAQDDSHGIVYMMLGMIAGMTWRAAVRKRAGVGSAAMSITPKLKAPPPYIALPVRGEA